MNITYIDEKVLKTFLVANSKNELDLGVLALECSDCRSAWICRETVNVIGWCKDGKTGDSKYEKINCDEDFRHSHS